MTNIDENLYSRQIYTIGRDAQNSLNNTSVLISGMSGLGVEIAKCIILNGIGSVTLHDTELLTAKDLSSNYYVSNENIGQNRARIVMEKLAKLNPYVNVSISQIILTDDLIKRHQIIIICDKLPTTQIYYNKIARQYGTKFILAYTFGLFGSIFCDFGNEFISYDTDGDQPSVGLLTEFKNGTFISNEPHMLHVGDIVTINMDDEKEFSANVTDIIDITSFKIKFVTSDIQNPNESKLLKNSTFTQIKQKTVFKFKSLHTSILKPEFVSIFSDDFDRSRLLHEFMFSVELFVKQHKHLPRYGISDDINEIMRFVNYKSDNQKCVIKKLANVLDGKFCPMDSIIGSLVAQEIIKASTKKYTPINQWLHIDFANVLVNMLVEDILSDEINNRYIYQRTIFGSTQDLIQKANIFIVGAGAIGCELLKNLAMIGVNSITITDMDIIEKSNLSRQFLFTYSDIGNSKSTTAKNAINKMNPDVEIVAQQNKVCSETNNIYNGEFFAKFDCIMTALDNIQARLYVDSLCVENELSLIDSGTLGTKGNVQVIVPHLTESYGSSSDPPEKEIPMCTIKNFPYQIEHCIQWGRNLFEGIFTKAPQNFLQYKNNPDKIKKMTPTELKEVIDDIVLVKNNAPVHQIDCIKFAYNLFHEHFRDQIKYLIKKYPKDSVTSENLPFWTGTKKFPKSISFNNEDDLCTNFIEATANLWANVFGLEHVTHKNVSNFIKKANPPNIKNFSYDIQTDPNKKTENNVVDNFDKLLEMLPNIEEIIDINVKSLEFEKDDDTNFHIDFVTHVSNLRATNYSIQTVDKLKTRGIAGKIIPAIITTTSLVAGLACMELIKILTHNNESNNENKNIGYFANSFVNVALPLLAFTEPIQAPKQKIGSYEYSIWNNLVFDDMKVKHFVSEIKNKIGLCDLDILSIYSGQYVIYSSLTSEEIKNKRLDMYISDIYKNILKSTESLEQIGNTLQVSVFFDTEEESDAIVCKINIDKVVICKKLKTIKTKTK